MKIGLLLGSFDPPHIGHLHAAYYALSEGVDKVWIVPAWQNPWKTNQTPWKQRYEMCKLVFNDDKFLVSMFDEGLKSRYTYEGLQVLKQIEPDIDFYIVGGSDIATQISKWKNGEWILENFGVIEVPRPGFTDKEIKLGIESSSTAIKDELRNGNIPIPFINKNVYEYIKENNLYGEGEDNINT